MQGMSFRSWQVTKGLSHGLDRASGFAGGARRVEGGRTLEGDGQREAGYWGQRGEEASVLTAA